MTSVIDLAAVRSAAAKRRVDQVTEAFVAKQRAAAAAEEKADAYWSDRRRLCDELLHLVNRMIAYGLATTEHRSPEWVSEIVAQHADATRQRLAPYLEKHDG